MITIIICILVLMYIVTTIISNIINIFQFLTYKDDVNEVTYEKHKLTEKK